MVSCWITSGYEISFISVPTVFIYVCNNKSMYDNFDFARSEIQRQVDMGILSKVSWNPLVINPINVVWTNKWHLLVDCRLYNNNNNNKGLFQTRDNINI